MYAVALQNIFIVHAHTMAMHWPAIVAPQLDKLKRRKQQDIDRCRRASEQMMMQSERAETDDNERLW